MLYLLRVISSHYRLFTKIDNDSREDRDSGCHSGSEGDSSSSSSSSVLGDSESSDSDESDSGRVRMRREAKREEALAKAKSAIEHNSRITKKDRLSLAEKQLDSNETQDLICLTCLKRFSNCQNLRR